MLIARKSLSKRISDQRFAAGLFILFMLILLYRFNPERQAHPTPETFSGMSAHPVKAAK